VALEDCRDTGRRRFRVKSRRLNWLHCSYWSLVSKPSKDQVYAWCGRRLPVSRNSDLWSRGQTAGQLDRDRLHWNLKQACWTSSLSRTEMNVDVESTRRSLGLPCPTTHCSHQIPYRRTPLSSNLHQEASELYPTSSSNHKSKLVIPEDVRPRPVPLGVSHGIVDGKPDAPVPS
jgi:hypothetical protein